MNDIAVITDMLASMIEEILSQQDKDKEEAEASFTFLLNHCKNQIYIIKLIT